MILSLFLIFIFIYGPGVVDAAAASKSRSTSRSEKVGKAKNQVVIPRSKSTKKASGSFFGQDFLNKALRGSFIYYYLRK